MENQHPIQYQLKTALQQKDWCEIWKINSIKKLDISLLQPFLTSCVESLHHPHDGFQREVLKLIIRLDITDDEKGKLWDICLGLWLNTKHIPSTRIKALEILIPIAKEYASLADEFFDRNTEAHINSLSPGIRKSCLRLLKTLSIDE